MCHQMIRELEHLMSKKRLREVCLFILKKTRHRRI